MTIERGPMFELREATRVYGTTVALAPVSLEIAHGERVALLGPSGSGKTTLLHLLSGGIQPNGGSVNVDGRPLAELGPGRELARLVGLIPQQFDLVPHLSVLHNVLAGRLGEWSLSRSIASLLVARDRHLAEEALVTVGIPDKIHERAGRLSGGEQQRVAIARLLVQGPKAILADEPVASLDPARAEDLIQLLVWVAEEGERTLVASLHAIPLAQAYFTRAVGLREGRIEFDLPVEELSEELLADLYDLQKAPRYERNGTQP